MGRTQAACGSPLDHSCSLDRFTNQHVFDKGRAFGDPCADAAGPCGVLPAFAPPAAPSDEEENVHERNQDLVLSELWYQLPKEEQVRFGGCFSRMILKILNRYDGLSGEDGA